MAWTGVITNAGATLLENWTAGSQTLTIDKATTGSGTLASEAQMRAAIAVSNEVEDASIISSAPTTGGTQYVVQVGAREDGAYALRQIGIWAHLSDNAPTLLALYQSDTDISIPATADNADFVYTMNAIVSMSNSGGMSVTIDRGAYVTQNALLDLIYPVGSIYMSANNVSPASFLGGTWAQLQDTFLLAAGSSYSAGATGGSATHTIAKANLPSSITGAVNFRGHNGTGNLITSASGTFSYEGETASSGIPTTSQGSSNTHFTQLSFNLGGSGTALDTMPPYLAVYMWQRTA